MWPNRMRLRDGGQRANLPSGPCGNVTAVCDGWRLA